MLLTKQIKAKRPSLRDSTINSYLTYIRKLHESVTGSKGEIEDLTFLESPEKVKQILEKYKPTTRKNIYNAVFVVLHAFNADKSLLERYSMLRDEEHQKYEQFVSTNTKSEKQEKNWVTMSEIDNILKRYRRGALDIYRMQKPLPKKHYNHLQEYIALLTYRNLPLRTCK